MVRWFKSGYGNWRGRCVVDTCDTTYYIWYREWPNLVPEKKERFQTTLQRNLDRGTWVEDTSLALDKDLLVDEGL